MMFLSRFFFLGVIPGLLLGWVVLQRDWRAFPVFAACLVASATVACPITDPAAYALAVGTAILAFCGVVLHESGKPGHFVQ